jgi:hypothetical protein
VLPRGPAAVPVTGQQHQIAAGRYRAAVTELDAGLCELQSRDQPVIADEPDDPPFAPPTAVKGTPRDFRKPRMVGTTQLDHTLTGAGP